MAFLTLSGSGLFAQHRVGLEFFLAAPRGSTEPLTNGIVFDVLRPMTLGSVDVPFSPSGGSTTQVNLRDAAGTLLGTFSGTNQGVTGTVAINRALAPGAGYRLDLAGSTGSYFQAGFAVDFSRQVAPGLVELRGPITGAPGLYPYFFNWRVNGSVDTAAWQLNRPEATLRAFEDGQGVAVPALVDPFAAQAPSFTTPTSWSTGFHSNGGEARIDLSSGSATANFDLAMAATELLPGGGGAAVTAAGQVVNVDLANPSFTFLFGVGSTPGFPSFSGTLSLRFSTLLPVTAGAQMVTLDATSFDGLALSQAIEARFTAPPTQEEFEGLTDLGWASELPGWADPGDGTGFVTSWVAEDVSNGTFSTDSPSMAHSGDTYIRCWTSSVLPNNVFDLLTPPFDVTQLSANRLEFALSRIGPEVGVLRVLQIDGPGLNQTLLATYSGADPNHTRGGQEWTVESLTFTPNAATVGFIFEYTPLGSVRGNIALDTISVR